MGLSSSTSRLFMLLLVPCDDVRKSVDATAWKRVCLAVLAAIVTNIWVAADEVERRTPIPLNASVMIFNEWGLRDADASVERIAAYGHRRVNFVITIHSRLDENLRPLNYGLIRAQDGWQFSEFDESLLAEFRSHLKKAFAKAKSLNLDIAILPHVDAAGPETGWRNNFDLDPLRKCGSYSYKEVMLDSIVAALTEATDQETNLDFALMGEMGQTVFMYPASYRAILGELRNNLRDRVRHCNIGISINYNAVTGNYQPTSADIIAVQQLLEHCDFLGFSCYGSVSNPPVMQDFTKITDAFAADLSSKGVVIPDRMALHFSEVGLGGGASSENSADSMTTEPKLAANAPWAGTSDPTRNPWESEPMRELRLNYHSALLEFLEQQPARWKVTAAFLWNTGSWCPYGLDVPQFKDERIIEQIRSHNEAADALLLESTPRAPKQ